jgi:hypothetical protein
MESKYASRKFGLTAFVILSSVAMVVFKVIDPSVWQTVTYATLGLYFTGNVTEKIFSK